eukprot:TRINITY_DN10115_c0_g1_i1.p1 TRINITY_DN10115_c0_g1~~TRINITY_DN10115_c0_g1_i1.p1  ORF type:complete len:456 (+),score=131.58 TRINITY_DN10115_c0_g1_i1:77-1444(+)
MVKIKMLSRSREAYVRDTRFDVDVLQHNPSAALHPFERAKEYTRALNAAKWQKVFAKPFMGALEGHRDGVNCLAKCPWSLTSVLSGGCDGEIRLWNLATKRTRLAVEQAHKAFVNGICFVNNEEDDSGNRRFLSCGDDGLVKLWRVPPPGERVSSSYQKPLETYMGETEFTGIDHQRHSDVFATAGKKLDVWNYGRAEPVRSFEWGCDTITGVRFNPVETSVLGSVDMERAVCIYDLRMESPVRKLVLNMRSNALAWNPMVAFNFTVANEDHNLYTFDMRRLDKAIRVHTDHVQAVLDVDYSPTGHEIVSGSYDRTIRLFNVREARSREVYFARRMQRIFCVLYSQDNRYVLSGSDDTNIRLWKADASAPVGVVHPRLRSKLNYQRSLIKRYQHLPEIRRVHKHQRVPKAIKLARDKKREMLRSRQRKEENVRRYTKKDLPHVPVGRKAIAGVRF